MQKLTPKAVIFDLGSTLIDFPVNNWEDVSRECSLAAHRVLRDKGVALPSPEEFLAEFEIVRAELREMAASTHREWNMVQAAEILLDKIGISPANEPAERFFEVFYETLEKHLYVYDDTIEILSRIKSKFGKIGLISNTIFPEKAHHRELHRFGLTNFFEFKIFSSTFGIRKPHPDIFIEAARLAGEEPRDCLYIGDRFLEDVLGPQSAGMSAILKVLADRQYPADMPGDVRKITCLGDLGNHLDI